MKRSYLFGERARDEIKRGFKDKSLKMPISEDDVQALPGFGESVSSPLVEELCHRGIARETAVLLCREYDEDHIKRKIDMFDYLKDIDSPLIKNNPAGWLRRAIEQDYVLSGEQMEHQMAHAQERKAEEKMREIREKAEKVQRQRIKHALANWHRRYPTDEDWVEEQIQKWINLRRKLREQMPSIWEPLSEEKIESQREQLRKLVPKTDEERKRWLMENDERCNLESIIREIEELTASS